MGTAANFVLMYVFSSGDNRSGADAWPLRPPDFRPLQADRLQGAGQQEGDRLTLQLHARGHTPSRSWYVYRRRQNGTLLVTFDSLIRFLFMSFILLLSQFIYLGLVQIFQFSAIISLKRRIHFLIFKGLVFMIVIVCACSRNGSPMCLLCKSKVWNGLGLEKKW